MHFRVRVAWVLAWRTNELLDRFPASIGWDAGNCGVRQPSWRMAAATTKSDLRHKMALRLAKFATVVGS